MELTPGQQRLLFVVIVIVLAGLGIYLISAHDHGTTATPAATPTPSASAASASAASEAATSVPPATVPPAPPPSTTASGADIYEWLPFSQAGLTAAATTTLDFAADYATWSYTEPATAYAAKLVGVTAPQELATLENGYAAVVGGADKPVSTGSGTITSITSFGASPTSITFAVAIAQRVVSTTGTTNTTPQYNITVVSTGTGWQVNDIELSGLGNQ